jgi:hypothetical protein
MRVESVGGEAFILVEGSATVVVSSDERRIALSVTDVGSPHQRFELTLRSSVEGTPTSLSGAVRAGVRRESETHAGTGRFVHGSPPGFLLMGSWTATR